MAGLLLENAADVNYADQVGGGQPSTRPACTLSPQPNTRLVSYCRALFR